MIVKIRDKELHLNPIDVKASKKLISNFLDSAKEASHERMNPTFYFTLLIVMHMLSQDLLNEIDPSTLETIYAKLKK